MKHAIIITIGVTIVLGAAEVFTGPAVAQVMDPASNGGVAADSASVKAGCDGEAYAFALKIREAVEARDLDALFELVDGELDAGPRKAFIEGKSFPDVFSEEWREMILTDVPLCESGGWRGYMMVGGLIWYHAPPDWDEGSIYVLRGSTTERVPKEVWWHMSPSDLIADRLLARGCFETVWMSGDNYEEYDEQFGLEGDSDVLEEFGWPNDFWVHPGRYFGGPIPLEPILASWGDSLSLAVKLSDCEVSPKAVEREAEYDRWQRSRAVGDVYIADSWLRVVTDCADNGVCYDNSYTTIRQISRDHCETLAPHFADQCLDLRLVLTADYTSGTMRVFKNNGIYGLIENPQDGALYVMPLVNLGNRNSALNVADALESND